MKKFFVILAALIAACVFSAATHAQENKAPSSKAAPVVASPAAPAQAASQPSAVKRPNFSIVFGSVTKIDTSDPAKPKLEVKSDVDNTTHTIEFTPWTNITKVTDISELKTGDTVRVMARKVDSTEVAMTVVFGKIRNVYAPRSAPSAAAASSAAPATSGEAPPAQQ